MGSRGFCCDSCCAVVFLSQGFEVYSSNHGSQAPSRVAPPPFRQEGRLQAPIPPSSYVGQSGWPGRFFLFFCVRASIRIRACGAFAGSRRFAGHVLGLMVSRGAAKKGKKKGGKRRSRRRRRSKKGGDDE